MRRPMWRILCVLLLVPFAVAHGDEAHDVPAWGSATLEADDTFSHAFHEARDHGYIDSYTQVAGTVSVVAGGPMAAEVSIHTSSFSPPVVEIGPGGTVTWTVVGDGLHTVTSTETVSPDAPGEDSPLGFLPLVGLLAAVVLRRRA